VTSPAAASSGWYVYGVVPASQLAADAFVTTKGVHPSGDIVLIADDDLAAITSDVPLTEFGEAAIAENLHDEAWLEEKVRAHEAVLEAALGRAPLVPFRFGTIYRSDEHVRNMLRENAGLAEALERLRGTFELGVKAFLDVEQFERARGGDQEPEGASSGRAYLLQKQRARRLAEDSAAFAAECAAVSHERLAAAAEDARANPRQRPEVSGREGEMILNGAYLVRAEGEGAFRQALAALEDSYAAEGVRYELTGPWPAYNFVVLEPEP
jgi:Gas vesicle synthesis protein GvpL/GvpF